ncbi:Uncharacterised protein [Clostridium tertium]|uniref:DUF1284 domain-containing protein n=1 Tax=Clostridium tertium TaxID=1559 RepID=A0A6N3EG97_9CLOT
MESIRIKPHHLLDILKLHGKGIEVFVKDMEFGHDFYKIANEIINLEVSEVTFTRDCDDICEPCKHRANNECSDYVSFLDNYSKDKLNKEIDDRLLKILGIKEEESYKLEDIFNLLMKKLSYSLFEEVWEYANEEELQFRFAFTIMGTYKVLEKYKYKDV